MGNKGTKGWGQVALAMCLFAACHPDLIGAAMRAEGDAERKRKAQYETSAALSRDRLPPRSVWWCEPIEGGRVSCWLRAVDPAYFCGVLELRCDGKRHISSLACMGRVGRNQRVERLFGDFSPALPSPESCDRIRYEPMSPGKLRAHQELLEDRRRRQARALSRAERQRIVGSEAMQAFRAAAERLGIRVVLERNELRLFDTGKSLCADLSWARLLEEHGSALARVGVGRASCLVGALAFWSGSVLAPPRDYSQTVCAKDIAKWRRQTRVDKQWLAYDQMAAPCQRAVRILRGEAGR